MCVCVCVGGGGGVYMHVETSDVNIWSISDDIMR